MEIPGRIIIITSNHPEVLDSALIRPGRIDVRVDFGYADRELVMDMFQGYLDIPFPIEMRDRLPEKLLTPAEVGQVLFKHFNDESSVEDIVNDLEQFGKARCVHTVVKEIETTLVNVDEPYITPVSANEPHIAPVSTDEPHIAPVSANDPHIEFGYNTFANKEYQKKENLVEKSSMFSDWMNDAYDGSALQYAAFD